MDYRPQRGPADDQTVSRRWSGCDVSHVEIPLAVTAEAAVWLYRPMLSCLGFSPTREQPGLTRWVSGSGRSSLVLIETARHASDKDARVPHTPSVRGLVLDADCRERIDTVLELATTLGFAVLVSPDRYSSHVDERGIVWCHTDGTIFELRFRERSTF